MKLRAIVLAVLSIAAVAQAGQAQTILYKPVKGAKTVYTLSFAIDSPGIKVIYEAKLTNEIVDVKTDGTFIVASYQTDGVTIVDGKKEASTAESITAVTTYDKFGKPKAIGGDNATPESFRVANLTSFIAPSKAVNVGDTWSVQIAASDAEKTPSAIHSYKVLAIDKGIATVEMNVVDTAKDYPGSAKGRVWVNVATGEQTKFDLAVKNMPIGGAYIDGKVLITKAS